MQSALNLRLALASFGLVFCAGIGILAYRAGYTVAAVLMGIAAVVAIIDLIVILKRRAARRKQNPNREYSLFE